MADFLKAGTKRIEAPLVDNVSPYVGSMADAMEKAFTAEWPVIMGSNTPEVSDHLRLMFISIAQGVVKHLENNKEAIKIRVPNTNGSGTTLKSPETINTKGILY